MAEYLDGDLFGSMKLRLETKEHHLKLYKKYHNSKVDISVYNLFQDIIKILPDHAAEINEVYLSAKGDQPGRP